MLAAHDLSRWPARGSVSPVRVCAALIISGVLLALSMHQINFAEFSQALRGANYWYVAAAVVVYFVDLGVRSLRWQFLLPPAQRPPLLRLYRALAIGYMVNNVLPGRVGELARAYVAGRGDEGSSSTALASVALERVLDGVTIVTLLGLTLSMLDHAPWVAALMRTGAIAFGLGLVFCALLVMARARCSAFLGHALEKVRPAARRRLVALVDHFLAGLATLRHPKQLLWTGALSVLVWIVGATTYVLVADAFGVHLSLGQALATICVVNLATALPQAPAGLGVFEAVTKQTFVLLGVGGSTALAATIALHAVLVFPVIVAGALLLGPRGVFLRWTAKADQATSR